MVQILLSSKENDFLREILISSMRHFSREIDADTTLLESSIYDDSKVLYSKMLDDDKKSLEFANSIYLKLLHNL